MLALIATLSPFAANALPMVGDVVGTNPEDATKALEAAGCTVSAFEAEDGKIEAMCADAASGKAMEVMIDPTTGAVTEIKASDD